MRSFSAPHSIRVFAPTSCLKLLISSFLNVIQGCLQVGGGINSDNCLSCIEEGASHVIVTSYVFNNGQMDLERLKDLVQIVGKERLVLDLSCRKKLRIDEELVACFGKYSPIPVTYAGGVTEMADLERIKTAGLDGVNVTVGSALDSICLQEVVA
ncbi:hypothetical protein JHK82_027187 [Glycine max]|nr:hypothetical protein JHK85_027812 [Glycine max]KAG5003173.1 hypothetical protein JHK86_027312 [Glycine max]KAG5126352.1 hypothetical protein JHK82_027187 [Glycine max]KAG5150951.1 hypothetical protein JHK84_027423 [Glycine max]